MDGFNSVAGTVDVSSPLPSIVYRKLRLDILNGILQPGQFLRQEELSRRFDVSRVPLREAMSRLAADGLVILRPRRGYAVTSLEPSEILEIFDLRAVVEEHAGSIAARARTKHDIDQVREVLGRMEDLDPRMSDYLLQWLRANYEFHAKLIGSTRREHLARYAGTLRDTVEPYIRVEVQITGDVTEAEEDHRAIFDAFCDGDAVHLAGLSRSHVEKTAQRLLRGLRRDKVAPRGTPLREGRERTVAGTE